MQQLLSSVATSAHWSAIAGIKLAVSVIKTVKGKSNMSAAVRIIITQDKKLAAGTQTFPAFFDKRYPAFFSKISTLFSMISLQIVLHKGCIFTPLKESKYPNL